jgi:hypothetical protein
VKLHHSSTMAVRVTVTCKPPTFSVALDRVAEYYKRILHLSSADVEAVVVLLS